MIEFGQQMLGSAVSKTQPQQLSLFPGACGQDKKIFVLGHDDTIFSESFRPDLAIIGLSLPAIQNMNRIVSSGA